MFSCYRLDADILAGDMPKEFESLKTEFDQHEGLLNDLEKQAAEYRGQGQIDAGQRLDQQVALLKVSYYVCEWNMSCKEKYIN